MSAGERLITVATCREPLEGAMLQSRLEAEGIESYLIDAKVSAIAWYLADAVGGAKVQVKSSDASRALEILESTPDTELSANRDEWSSPTPCVSLLEKAVKAGLFGILFFPLQFYSLWLLLRAFRCKADEPFYKKCFLVLLVNGSTIVAVFFVFVSYLGPLTRFTRPRSLTFQKRSS